MIQEVYNFPIHQGGGGNDDSDNQHKTRKILGDLINATEPETISRVFLGSKLYETWYYGRTVLVGDAAHTMATSAGQGGVEAMEDAVVLANCLYEISDGQQAITPEKITEAFKNYRDQRYSHAKCQVESSSGMAKILSGQKLSERVLRSVIYNIPKWLVSQKYLKQAGFIYCIAKAI
ncbi:hypothetical protein BGZ65_001772 [Modicella reniformis]|uniref:FAD-binding domain-containing protein n=1 Tax=Modicella reniformis TaxID=1440133 RepID=A0A9P6SU98_9FUNG|nr:hypothetical protein BGZ65_001772 [Modicella reniformis]